MFILLVKVVVILSRVFLGEVDFFCRSRCYFSETDKPFNGSILYSDVILLD